MAKNNVTSIFGPGGVPKLDEIQGAQSPLSFDADQLMGIPHTPEQPTVFFRNGAFEEAEAAVEHALPSSPPSLPSPPPQLPTPIRVAARRAEEELEHQPGLLSRVGTGIVNGGKAVGKWTIVKPVEWIVVKPVQGAWNGIKWAGNGTKNFFFRSKPHYESNISGGKLLAGIGVAVLAVGALVGLSKLSRGSGASEDVDAESIRAAELAAIKNDIKAVQAENQALYANQGSWTKNAPQPSASYQQAAIEQPSQAASMAK